MSNVLFLLKVKCELYHTQEKPRHQLPWLILITLHHQFVKVFFSIEMSILSVYQVCLIEAVCLLVVC